MATPVICIAVRALVEHLLRSGDLRVDYFGSVRALEGIRVHQNIQRQRPESYQAEVTVSHVVDSEALPLCITGRIDGIFMQDQRYIVEEIKSTTRPFDELEQTPDPVHWGQAQCYAYMWGMQAGVDSIDVQLTYVHPADGATRELVRTFAMGDLACFFDDLVARYRKWLLRATHWLELRDQTIAGLDFPFDTYRQGQREMAVEVYRCLRDGGHLLIQAATGIGKTMAALFPGVKALGGGLISKVIFLTARTTGRLTAEATLEAMRDKGLRLRAVSITAKEKICLSPERACLPEECAYARGYYDRVNDAIGAAFDIDALNRSAIEAIAEKFTVCPFELSLELIHWADCVIGDYNYAFDPRVRLQSLLPEPGQRYAILVDEAHNLVDRSREMFSAQLEKLPILALRRALKTHLPHLFRALGRVNAWMAATRRDVRHQGGIRVEKTPPDEMLERLQPVVRLTENWLSKNIRTPFRDELLQFYFEIIRFLRVAEGYDGRFATIYESIGQDLRVKLFCIDPSIQLQESWQACQAAVLFSATLTPVDYFQDLLGCPKETGRLNVRSPFPVENLAVYGATWISTYYRDRQASCDTVTRIIGTFVTLRKGHYLLFFPSYAYLAMVLERFQAEFEGVDTIAQTPDMSESAREDFLNRFQTTIADTLVGFAVMGGVFGEGIDLKGDRLTGAVIVGVGLPGIGPERDLIRQYYDSQGERGFAYAYQYPGINRVLQAAGRVIRSQSDRGAILLIDQRYVQERYRCLLPLHWQLHKIEDASDLAGALTQFWRQ